MFHRDRRCILGLDVSGEEWGLDWRMVDHRYRARLFLISTVRRSMKSSRAAI